MKDLYRKWHEHPGHYPLHWGVLIFTSIFVTSLLIGQIDETYSEYPEIQRVTASAGGDHDYFNQLVSHPSHWKSYSLRDPAQLNYPDQGGYAQGNSRTIGLWVTYDPANDLDPNRQDAAKVVIPAFAQTAPGNVLVSDISESDTQITMVTGGNHFINTRSLKIDDEIVEIVSSSGTTFNVKRGTQGTTPAPHTSGTSVKMSVNSLLNQVRLPLGTSDGNVYFFTWDGYWTDSYLNTNTHSHKTFQFTSGGDKIWHEPRTRYDGGRGETLYSGFNPATDVATIDVRSYQSPCATAGQSCTNWSETGGNVRGPGTFAGEPMTPMVGQFVVKPNTWTRFFVRYEQRANDWDSFSMWVADENNNAVQIYDSIPVSARPATNAIDKFWLEYNSSQDRYVRGNQRDWVSYFKNFVALKNPPSDISPFLQRPGAGGTLPPPVLDTTAPTVSLTAPSNNATVSGTVSLTATASDNIGVSGVQFKLDGVNIASEDNSSPYSISWNTTGTANGAKVLTAVARDAAGNTRTSSPINVTVSNTTAPVGDTTAPSVSITAPSAGATLSGTTNVTANASDNVGVVGVQFKLDGVNLGSEDTTSPYSLSWNTTQSTNGAKSLTAVARDQAGNTTTSSAVNVTVTNNVVTPPPPSDSTAPSTPSNLTATAVSSNQVNLSWSASTDNVAVTGYRLESCAGTSCTNFTQIESLTGIAYSNLSLNSAAIYRYRVRAVDAAGNFSNYSSIATATTQAAPDTTLPTVSLTSPANGAEVSGNVNITATASDNVGVSGVQFKLDGINLGAEDTTSPYSISWDTTESTNGSKSLIAIARDQAGNTRASTAVSVTVSNEVATPTDTTNPSRPTNLSANPVSSSQINLSWSASTDNVGVVGYRVFRNGIQIATAITTTTYQDKGRSASTSYAYTVLAYDAAGNTSSQSNSISATTEARASSPVVIKPTPTPTPTTPVVTNPTTPTVPVSYNPPLPPTQTTSLPSRLQNIFKPTVEESAPADNSTDVSAPLIQKFAIENTDSPKTVKVTFDASDTGGANLWRAYLFRAEYEEDVCDETDKSGCVWTAVENSTAPEGSEQWSTTLEHKLTPGTHWYSFQVIDRAGNRGFEQEPIKIIKPESILKDLFLRILRLVGWNR